MKSNVFLALLHYPVYNKDKEIITSAVTNLDIHDIARSARTYDLEKYYLVTPLKEQIVLIKKIIKHWTEGYGASYNEDRKKALEIVDVKEDLDKDPIAGGLEAIASGFSLRFPEDAENLSHQLDVYDALYAWCRMDVAQNR